MKSFIKDIIINLIIYTIIISSINYITPYYWGNESITTKINYLNNSTEKYNTFFFGSSRIYRHIIPNEFDKIAKTKSFNLGATGMFHYEQNYILRKFLYKFKYIENVNTIILGNSTPKPIAKINLHSNRTRYYVDCKTFKEATHFFIQKGQYKQVYYYTIAFIENLLSIGSLSDKLKSIINKESTSSVNDTILKQKGFYSLNQQSKHDKRLKTRNQAYLTKLENNDYSSYNPVNLEVVHSYDFNNTSIYYIPKITINPKYKFDRGHYNELGAKIISRKIARAFNKNKAKE